MKIGIFVMSTRIAKQDHLRENKFFVYRVTALSIKAGKDNVTTNTPGLFGCKKIYFQHPFHGRQQVKIFASFGHNIGSPGHRYGGAVWVEFVSTSGFTACVLEFGDGSNSTSEINWLALQSLPLGTQLETVHLNAWTTGTKCMTIKFKQVRFLRSTTSRIVTNYVCFVFH